MAPYRFRVQSLAIDQELFSLEVFDQFEKTIDVFLDTLSGQTDLDLTNDKVPLYGRIWPSAIRLSEYFFQQHRSSMAGKRVLEIGCGLALPSIVAARMGADVVATDYLAEIGTLLSRNMLLNNTPHISYQLCDYRACPKDSWPPFDFILASEVTYERQYFAPLIAFLQQVATKGSTIYLADPLRTHHSELIREIELCGQFALTHIDCPLGSKKDGDMCRILCLTK